MGYFDLNDDVKKALLERNEKRNSTLGIYATKYNEAVRRFPEKNNEAAYYRSTFGVDIERILNNPFYNRYSDKTQVFSFYKNDDITRRALHVQLVSRISRNIGAALGLNLELIEAIALGHDMGHTPFGHEGERILDELYSRFNKRFNHNVHSVKVLDTITNLNKQHGLTLQTLDGILCHNGEKVHEHYEPSKKLSFNEFDERFRKCYYDDDLLKTLRPCTLEGCVVRVSDIIAYVGKDRQDLIHAKQQHRFNMLSDNPLLGKKNSDIVPRLTVNIIKNSIGKNYIGFDKEVYEELDVIRKDNYNIIYKPDGNEKEGVDIVTDMAGKLFDKFYQDITACNKESSVFRHYLNNTIVGWSYFADKDRTELTEGVRPEDIVIDYMACMTDDYFIDIFRHYFPKDELNDKIKYVPYDEELI